jgi:hypothetical protein
VASAQLELTIRSAGLLRSSEEQLLLCALRASRRTARHRIAASLGLNRSYDRVEIRFEHRLYLSRSLCGRFRGAVQGSVQSQGVRRTHKLLKKRCLCKLGGLQEKVSIQQGNGLMMDTGQTVEMLADITDPGFFETLATAILRYAQPEYRALAHPGVNVDGRTVKAPLDGITFALGADPPHMIAVHHTICSREGLHKKWLHDPSIVKSRKNRPAATQPGDLLKTIAIVADERKSTPEMRATLVLTTNQEPNLETVLDVHSVARASDIDIDLWSRSRLARFLDDDPTGQWLRRQFLGVKPERLSESLLAELSKTSLVIHSPRDAPEARIDRELDRSLTALGQKEVTFLVASSGLGKTVACHKWLSAHIEKGGVGLVLSPNNIAGAATIDAAVEAALLELHPGLIPGSGSEALAMCSAERPLYLVIEDINRSGQESLLAEKIAAWASKSEKSPASQRAFRSICPIWPQVLESVSEDARKRILDLTLFGSSFSPSEGRVAVKLRARQAGLTFSSMTAETIAAALGNDPLLIALHDPFKPVDANRVTSNFVERSIARLAQARRDRTPADYRRALLALGNMMLECRQLNPLWTDVCRWAGITPEDRLLLGHLLLAGEFLHLAGNSMEQRIGFRHDRLRDCLLIDGATDLLRAGMLKDEIVDEPYFAEIIAGVLAEIPVLDEFVDRVRKANPLALFHALRLFREPATDVHQRILLAIDQWLNDPRSRNLAHQRLRWEALTALAQTESSKVVEIVHRFSEKGWPGLQALFCNGDVLGGIELCRIVDPGSSAPWRDEQIEHAKLRFGSDLSQKLGDILRSKESIAELRSGALRLAGHLAEPNLAEAIEVCWKTDSTRHERLDDYLWAFAECCNDDPERFLKPICDTWAALPSKSESDSLPSPRDDLAAHSVRWAFRRWVPAAAIAYFVKRGADQDLRWPITYMLHDIDHPLAIRFTVLETSSALREIEGSGKVFPFAFTLKDDWRRRQEEGAAMSTLSRQLLLDYWKDPSTDKHVRDVAFQLWSATERESDLDILRSSDLPQDLSDRVLRERLVRHDESAIPQLLEKLQQDPSGHWWYAARNVWSPELLAALDDDLERRRNKIKHGLSIQSDENIVAELIMRLPAETAEALLEKHWDHVHLSSYFVQASILVGTPRLLALANSSLSTSLNPGELLSYFGLALSRTGYPPIARETQIETLLPYLTYLKPHEISRLWDLCNEHGWYRMRQSHLDPLIRKSSGVVYLDDLASMTALDEMVKRNPFPWIDLWLEDYAKTGVSADVIIGLLRRWLESRRTIESLRLVSQALCLIGRRADLAILNVPIESDAEGSDMLRADTVFSVRRRTLR